MDELEKQKLFFQYLGQVWSRILIIENLAKIALAIQDGEESLFPNRTPYQVGDEYITSPKSLFYGFDKLTEEFNRTTADIKIPEWLPGLRHALAHGMIFQINHSIEQQLIKFKKREGKVFVEYADSLRVEQLQKWNIELDVLRSNLINHIKSFRLQKNNSGVRMIPNTEIVVATNHQLRRSPLPNLSKRNYRDPTLKFESSVEPRLYQKNARANI